MIAGGRRELWVDEVAARARPRDIWFQVAVISLTLALLDGYGAYDQLLPVTPMKYVLVQLPLLTTTFILCPRGSMNRVFLPLASVLFVGWWIASYLWDANRAGWISASLRDLSTIVAIVVLSQVLGAAEFIRVLLRSGYIAIGLIFVALLVQPGRAYDVAGAAPGLHGGFIHKNAMAPCLLVTAAVVLCFHPQRKFRTPFVLFVGVLMFLGQTTTGLATLGALVLVNYVLCNYTSVVDRLGRAAGVLMLGATMLAVAVAAESFSSAVLLSGKDLTFSARTVIWDGVTAAIGRQRWTGYGYGVWQNIWVDPIRSINLKNGFLVAEAHSAPLDLMLRLGIVGLLLYLLQLFTTIRVGWRGLKRSDPLGRLALLFCAIVVFVGFSESLVAYGLWPALLVVFCAINRDPKPVGGTRRSRLHHTSVGFST